MLAIKAFASSHSGAAGKSSKELPALPLDTRIDSIDAVPEGLFLEGKDRFAAAADAVVIVDYVDDTKKSEYEEMLPMTITGHFDENGNAVIDKVTMDTSSFDADGDR
jgi:hypothetical protein